MCLRLEPEPEELQYGRCEPQIIFIIQKQAVEGETCIYDLFHRTFPLAYKFKLVPTAILWLLLQSNSDEM